MIYATLLLLLWTYSACSQGDCPSGSHPYTINSCIAVYSDEELSFSDANTRCSNIFNYGKLTLIASVNELLTLQSYVRAFGNLDGVDQYSVGYMYDDGGDLVGVDGLTAPDSVTDNIAPNGLTEDSSTCITLHINGSFVPVGCTDIQPFICQYNLTAPGALGIFNDVPLTNINPALLTVAYGDSFNLSCNFLDTSATSEVSWTLNGEELAIDSYTVEVDASQTDLLPMVFISRGTYTCHVTNTDGRTASFDFDLFPDPNETLLRPNSVDNIIALPNTQTSLFVQWLVPNPSYAISPLLLHYTLHYSTDRNDRFMFNVTDLTTDSIGMGTHILEGLDIGTQYYITILANNAAGTSDIPGFITITETFGQPPSSSPADVTLARSDDNTALLATWSQIDTQLPTGEISFYQVEFRAGGARDSSTIFIAPGSTMSSIFNIIDAQSYEVRVASAVQVARDPAEYALSSFSEWVGVDAIVPISEIPSEIPTVVDPVLSEDATIVLSVVLPIVVILFVAIIIVVGLALYLKLVRRKGHDDYTDRGKKEDNIELKDN